MSTFNAKKKCRQYSDEYLKYGFVPSINNKTIPMCLLCEKTFSNDAMKPAKMMDHLERIHFDKKDKDIEYFKMLKERLITRPNLTRFLKSSTSANSEGGLKASYSISFNIAKKGKPYTIGEEIILPAIKDVIENVMKTDPQPVLKCIPLSGNTVQRRIEEMANDVERTLISELQHCKFAIQLDESTFGSSNILMAYVRFSSPSLNDIVDEFLFASYLNADSKGETIFLCLEDYLNKHNVPLENITAVATDGAPAMVGRYRGFSVFLKEKVPTVRTVHCVLHRQHLVAKKLSGELHEALKVCIRSINKIKTSPLNSRLFANLCEENDETFNQLLLHTEVRWLSRGDSLQRLVNLYNSSEEFLWNLDRSLCNELKLYKHHLFYLADIYSKFNEVQKRLQGKNITIIQARTMIMSFQVKLELFKSSLTRKDFKYFPNLQILKESENIPDCELEIFIKHLDKLIEDFKKRFEDLENMHVPEWLVTPFDMKIDDECNECDLEDELVEMSVDLEAKVLFKRGNISGYWRNINIATKYPKLRAAAEPFLLAFPTSYMVEAGFSHANTILTKQRNRLNLENRGDLRLKLTNFQPNINSLAAAHQPQPSH